MTRDFANELLFLWKVGAQLYPPHVITKALYVTGDLDATHLDSDAGLVRLLGAPARLEGLRVGSRADHGEERSGAVLAAPRVAVRADAKE